MLFLLLYTVKAQLGPGFESQRNHAMSILFGMLFLLLYTVKAQLGPGFESQRNHAMSILFGDAFFVALIFKYLSFHCLVVRLYSQSAAGSWVRIPAESLKGHLMKMPFLLLYTVKALLGPGFESQRNHAKGI